MVVDELIRQWKQPSARQGELGEHPCGEIVLRSGGGLARRSGLLTAQVTMRQGQYDTTTTGTTHTEPTVTMTWM